MIWKTLLIRHSICFMFLCGRCLFGDIFFDLIFWFVLILSHIFKKLFFHKPKKKKKRKETSQKIVDDGSE